MLLDKAAYGLCEAPRAWWLRLKRELEACGFTSMGTDPCVMTLYEKDDKGEDKLCGAIGTHVDDLLCAGFGAVFEKAMAKLESKLRFGARKFTEFLYTGVRYRQAADFSIRADQDEYSKKLQDSNYRFEPGTLKLDKTDLHFRFQGQDRRAKLVDEQHVYRPRLRRLVHRLEQQCSS